MEKWNNCGVLYKEYPNEFIDYVNGLKKHNIELSDLRLKQICKKWDIRIRSDIFNGGYWVNGEFNEKLQKTIIDLVFLKKNKIINES